MNANRLLRSLPVLLLLAPSLNAAEPPAEQVEFFEKKIRPLLVEHCFACHSPAASKLKGGLRVDSREAFLAGGDSGAALVPGIPEKSRLIEAILYKNVELQMPPKGKLPATAIADLTAWVKMGAPWPGSAEPQVLNKIASFDLEQRKAKHWAWKPIRSGPLPAVKDSAWPLAPSDRFILAKLEAKGIGPATQADPRVLLRRLYFDLIGLPPSPEEMIDFEKEYAVKPQATWEKTVDRLLASPRYGERWARHWLDLVRYGESRGHEFEPTIPNAWQYRDYVIRALNSDVPYHQYVMEHIAGDLLPSPRINPQEKFNESVIGTGFWHLGEEVHSPVDIRADEADRFDNRLDVFSKTFLGLTVACARCHDHKFDAISTKDYYSLYGFLRSSSYRLVRFDSIDQNKNVMAEIEASRKANRGAILKALAETLKPGIQQLPELLLEAHDSRVTGKPSKNELVQFWVTYLEKAARNPDDPFHAWATLPVKPTASEMAEHFRKFAKKVDASTPKTDVVVDYANLQPGQWIPDDAAYGSGPVQPGKPRFGTEKLRPIIRFHDRAAGDLDPALRGMKLVPGTQSDHGALGVNVRSGRTLHTPGFTITSGKVHFLVKGTGRAYAAVDAHTVIAGPLHGALILNFVAPSGFQWVTQDLSAYLGHRAHLEFSPNDENDFSIAMVVQGDRPPAPSNALTLLSRNLAELKEPTFDGAAELQGRLLQEIIAAWEKDSFNGTTPENARLANWMLDNAGLLGVKDWETLAKTAEPFLEEQAKLAGQLRKESRLALALIDNTGVDEHVFIRGSHKALGESSPRRLLEALAGTKAIDGTGSGRLELAKQMIDPKVNPFISRVIVNRVWHHLFGRGIVGSTDNFGELGERPTHPELLDHLAARFAEEGWSIKKLIRELVLSRAYRMSSQPDEKADTVDPENLLLHRMRLRRLEGEAIRDAMLHVSGRLNDKMYGPSIPIYLTPFLEGRGRPASGPVDGDGRRSVYIAVRRNFLSPMLMAFDTPSPFSTVGRRTVSNVPAQALILMNDPFVHQMASLWGKKIDNSTGTSKERVVTMYRQAFTRSPSEKELNECVAFLEEQLKVRNSEASAWIDLAHVLFNVKQFIFVE